MDLKIKFDLETIKNKINNKDWLFISDYLKELFKLQIYKNGQPLRFEFNEEVVNILQDILKIQKLEKENNGFDVLILETLRSLRNSVTNDETKTYLSQDEFVSNLKSVLILHESNLQINKIGLQFLINLVINNNSGANIVYKQCKDIIEKYLIGEFLIYETSALLYNISLYTALSGLNLNVIQKVFDLYKKDNGNEYLHFLIEKLIEHNNFWDNYNQLCIENKLIVLEILKHNQIKSQNYTFPEKGLVILVTQFINSSEVIFDTISSRGDNLQPYEASLLLEVISSVSSNNSNYLVKLQENSDLLIQAAILLINVHKLGKMSENCFSPIQRLSDVKQPNEEIQSHPAFSFKGNLIRLVGNLCWKCEKMQNLTREAELIPVILECCNIDAKNPFIMQWAILAIRNICEKNNENQDIIAGLRQEGTVGSRVLEESGITLHSDGDSNQIKLVSLKSIKDEK